MDRPQLGQRISATSFIRKEKFYNPNFKRVGISKSTEWREYEGSIEGLYIGYRTLSNGDTYTDFDWGAVFEPTHHFEAWMVVTDPRRNPIYILPERANIKEGE